MLERVQYHGISSDRTFDDPHTPTTEHLHPGQVGWHQGGWTDEIDFSTRRKTTWPVRSAKCARDTGGRIETTICSFDVELFTTQHVLTKQSNSALSFGILIGDGAPDRSHSAHREWKIKPAFFMRTLVTRETERYTTYGRGANLCSRRRVLIVAAGYDWLR